MVARAARDSGHRNTRYVESWRDVPALLAGAVAPGDVILTLGAGDICDLARELAAAGEAEAET
jgi:UDP-N-acetylmuramate-alanine ligase